MKKTLAMLLLVGITCQANATETIRFASSATYPPFEFYDQNNQIIGFDVNLVNALCAEMKVTCTITNNPFDTLIASLKLRRYDAVISGMDITPERSKQVLFTQPYYANSAIFIAKKGRFKSADELNSKKVGMENGTTHQKYIHDKQPQINTVSYDSYQTAVLDVKNGRIDAVFGDTAVVNEWLKNNPDLDVVGENITDQTYFGTGMAIAVRSGNTALADRFNTALDTLKTNGTYQQIHDKWLVK